MTRSLLDYHFLEDGELNRLWYEENDARARDAFQIRWWIGTDTKHADVVAGKDLLANYHTLFMHRCIERGILGEEAMTKVFQAAVKLLVAEFPSGPIEKFEDVLLTFVDRGIDEVKREIPTPSTAPAADQKKKLEAALTAAGARGQMVRDWLTTGSLGATDADGETLLETVRRLLADLDGDAARFHPLVATAEPEASKLDPSVAVPHFHAKPLFQYAFQGGTLTKRENEHIEFCQPCRQRCMGALLALIRFRGLLGGELPKLPEIAPQFTQMLHGESIGIPQVRATSSTKEPVAAGGGGGKGMLIGIVVVLLVAVVIAIAVSKG